MKLLLIRYGVIGLMDEKWAPSHYRELLFQTARRLEKALIDNPNLTPETLKSTVKTEGDDVLIIETMVTFQPKAGK